MQFMSLTPMLWVDNIQTTIEYYTQVLGFEISARSDEWGWANLKRDSIEIMICLPNQHTPYTKPHFTGSLYINVDDINSYWEQLSGKVNILYPPEDFEYGMREFAILDCNGYTIQFGQSIA